MLLGKPLVVLGSPFSFFCLWVQPFQFLALLYAKTSFVGV